MKQPQQLKRSTIGGIDISSIFVPTGTEGGYFETMLFLNGKTVEGLRENETCRLYDNWEDNHKALYTKVGNILAFGPA
jgi:hypothetical protein